MKTKKMFWKIRWLSCEILFKVHWENIVPMLIGVLADLTPNSDIPPIQPALQKYLTAPFANTSSLNVSIRLVSSSCAPSSPALLASLRKIRVEYVAAYKHLFSSYNKAFCLLALLFHIISSARWKNIPQGQQLPLILVYFPLSLPSRCLVELSLHLSIWELRAAHLSFIFIWIDLNI